MAECRDLTQEARDASVHLSSSDKAIGTVIDVTCSENNQRLVGPSQLTCLNTTLWNTYLPTCIPDITEREIILLATTCSVILILLVIIIFIGITFALKRSKTKRKRNERLAQTLERLSIRDPLDELVRRESRRSSMGYRNDSMTSIPTANGDITRRKMYKIWNNNRDRRTFAFADDLDDLIDRGREKLGLKGKIQVVLEEDGTEVDSDEILQACTGKVLILKSVGEQWRNNGIVTTLDTLPPDSTRF